MTARRRPLLPFALAGHLVTVGVPAETPSVGSPGKGTATLQQQVETALADTQIPGLVVALREKGGSERVVSAGWADIRARIPMRTDQCFYIGTISQSMLAAVVLMLQEEGRWKLADPISLFVDLPHSNGVTLGSLLDHSSGLADWTGNDLATTDNPRMPDLLRTRQTIDNLLAVVADEEPSYAPGERQQASYTNMLLLTRLIEAATGQPARRVLEKRIFEPLGLRDTRYLDPGETPPCLAGGYRAEAGWGEPLEGGLTEVGWADRNLGGLADMGIVSTASDVLRYHEGLREGRLIPPAVFETMRTVRPGKINGLGYLVMRGARGTWEGNTGHAVGHLGINLYHLDRELYLVVLGNLGDTGLPVARLYDLRYVDRAAQP